MLCLRIRLPAAYRGHQTAAVTLALDTSIYSLESATELVNYAIKRNAAVTFTGEDGEPILLDPTVLKPLTPGEDGGAIAVFYKDDPAEPAY